MIYADRKTKEILSEVSTIVNRLEHGGHDDHMLWQRLGQLAYAGLDKTGYTPRAGGDTFLKVVDDKTVDTRTGEFV